MNTESKDGTRMGVMAARRVVKIATKRRNTRINTSRVRLRRHRRDRRVKPWKLAAEVDSSGVWVTRKTMVYKDEL